MSVPRDTRRRYMPRIVDETPDKPEPGIVYLIREGGSVWSAALLCPSDCGVLIQLSLLKGDRPRWSYYVHKDGTVSLFPSVARTVGCRSHFILRKGAVRWFRPTRTA